MKLKSGIILMHVIGTSLEYTYLKYASWIE